MDLEKKKILFADLDGTLIVTASGKTFAEDATDFRIRKDVLDRIRALSPYISRLVIVTNQAGIPQYVSNEDFQAKLYAVVEFIRRYCDVICSYQYCTSQDAANRMRKPNTGMLAKAERLWFLNMFRKGEMLMIGDASGKPGDFSDSDRKCAENYGIDYLDVEDFVRS